MSLITVGQLSYMHFTVFAADGVTPLPGQAGACTDWLSLDGAAAPEAVAIAEIPVATGHYFASFTPLSVGSYDLEVTCPDGRVQGEEFDSFVNDLDTLLSPATVIEGALTLEEYLRIMFAALANESTGGGTANLAFRNLADTLDRIQATVDATGNRLVVAVDGS